MPFQEAGAEGNEVTTSSGLQYIDLTIGTGATAERDRPSPCITQAGWKMGRNSTVPWTEASRSLFLWALGESSRDGTRASRA